MRRKQVQNWNPFKHERVEFIAMMDDSEQYFAPRWVYRIKTCTWTWTALQLPIRQRLSKFIISASKPSSVGSFPSQKLTGQQRLRYTCTTLAGIKTNPHPNTRSPLTPKVKSPGPSHSCLVTTLREQLHLWMLSHSDTYCSIKQFLALPSCISTQMVTQEKGRREGRRHPTAGQTFSFEKLSHSGDHCSVFPENKLSPITRLMEGGLGHGKYGCSEFLFSC